jgi:hypothetical protein
MNTTDTETLTAADCDALPVGTKIVLEGPRLLWCGAIADDIRWTCTMTPPHSNLDGNEAPFWRCDSTGHQVRIKWTRRDGLIQVTRLNGTRRPWDACVLITNA